MQDKLLDLEARSMHENLIFYELEEPKKPKGVEAPTSDYCEDLERDLIIDTLDIVHINKVFDRADSMGGERA